MLLRAMLHSVAAEFVQPERRFQGIERREGRPFTSMKQTLLRRVGSILVLLVACGAPRDDDLCGLYSALIECHLHDLAFMFGWEPPYVVVDAQFIASPREFRVPEDETRLKPGTLRRYSEAVQAGQRLDVSCLRPVVPAVALPASVKGLPAKQADLALVRALPEAKGWVMVSHVGLSDDGDEALAEYVSCRLGHSEVRRFVLLERTAGSGWKVASLR